VSDRTADLESKVAALTEQVARLGERVASLETGQVAAGARPVRRVRRAEEATAEAGASTLSDATRLVGAALSYGGRTLLVLAGAFVLRALTDSQVIPGWLGVALGFAYAATWIGLADRAARAGAGASAGVHGFAALIIAFPLLFEAASKFKLLSPTAAIVALALVTSALIGVAARRRLQALAWTAAVGSVVTVIALMVLGGRMVPGTLFLIALGVECLWLAYVLDWYAIRWPTAVIADLAVIALAVRAVAPDALEGPGSANLAQAALLAAFVASFGTRTLLMNRGVVAFEVFQTIGAVAAGLGGAAFVAARVTDSSAVLFGVAATLFGLGAYVVAFFFRGRRAQDVVNFPFYTSVGLLMVGAGTTLLLDGSWLGLVWSLLAAVSGELAVRFGRRTLAVQAAVYAFGAALASGLLAVTSDALLGSASRAWSGPGSATLVALAAAAACAWFGSRPAATPPTLAARLPQLAMVALAAAGIAALIVWQLVPPLAGTPGAAVNRGAVASLRTAVLVVGTFSLAWAGRRAAWREAGWLAYPLLVATGLKILLEDLPTGKPATLFVSFGLYGAALLLVPRLRPRAAPPPPAPVAVPAAVPAAQAEPEHG
jgi:hypothetical protein